MTITNGQNSPARTQDPTPTTRPTASRVLVVEDDRAAADILRVALLRQGHTVQLAHDGLQAVNSLRRELPDIVILDLALPLVSGIEVLRVLRTRGSRPVPTIVVSGFDPEDFESDLSECMPDKWLKKPCRPSAIHEMVVEVMARREP